MLVWSRLWLICRESLAEAAAIDSDQIEICFPLQLLKLSLASALLQVIGYI